MSAYGQKRSFTRSRLVLYFCSPQPPAILPLDANGISGLKVQLTQNQSFTRRHGESVVGFLLRRHYQMDAAATVQPPSVQLGDNLLYRFGHGFEIALSTAVNGVDTLPDYIAMPVGALRTGRRLPSPDGYDLVRMFHY